MESKITCLVTLHGIGFQRTPTPANSNVGYADALHQHLFDTDLLRPLLSDDPERNDQRKQPGEKGVIYVQSRFRDDQDNVSREEGLKRLGSWFDNDHTRINTEKAPLVASDKSVAHVALVYSNLEPTPIEVGADATLMTFVSSLFSASHYTHLTRLVHMAISDVEAALMETQRECLDQPMPSTFPRTDFGSRYQAQETAPFSPSVEQASQNIRSDVAAYVCYNEERERVRSFVREALMRLACREDVGKIVLNTHSNGTVIVFDVLRQLPKKATDKITAFVTAGSPLRKYVDLFHWGPQIQSLYTFTPWYNFWDRYDPVANPLQPPVSWHVGDAITQSEETLFSRIDLDSIIPSYIQVEDKEVHNVKNSCGGGLQAHNYWDNEKEFVPKLAEIVVQ